MHRERDLTAPSPGRPDIILIVDDQVDNLRVLARALEGRGRDVRPVRSGRDALAAISVEAPDLILLDVCMPELLDGWEVARRIQATPATAAVPIIFVSAQTELADRVRAFELGAVNYVTKPFQLAEVIARVGTHLEIQRQRRALTETNRRLSALEAMRDDLAHMMAHDVRSPLMGLSSLLQTLRDDLAEGPHASWTPDLEEAIACTERIEQMVSSFLDLRRLEVARMPVEPESRDLRALVEDALSSLGRLAGDRPVALVAAPTGATAYCDPALTKRVVANLVSNALKHTPRTEGIQVELALEGDRALVRVHNHGPGIPPEHQALVFEKFGPLARSGHGGTGLGLAFAKLAVEVQGGRVGVESALGHGSTFWLELPARAPL